MLNPYDDKGEVMTNKIKRIAELSGVDDLDLVRMILRASFAVYLEEVEESLG